MSRFSGDLSLIDRMFSIIVDDIWNFTFLIVALVVIISVVIPEMSAVLAVGLSLYVTQFLAVDRVNREAKREANMALAPLITVVTECVNARELTRVLRCEDFFSTRTWKALDEYGRYNHFSLSVLNWGAFQTCFISFVVSIAAALLVVLQRGSGRFDDPSQIGLALSYSFLLPYFLQVYSMVMSIFTSGLTSLERLLQYKGEDVPQEPEWLLETDEALLRDGAAGGATATVGKVVVAEGGGGGSSSGGGGNNGAALQKRGGGKGTTVAAAMWPSRGAISFRDVALRYRPGLPLSLKGVSLDIRGGEKIGVVGRTGAGKSSLVSLLFRLLDCTGGSIHLDGQDINDIGIQTLRRALTIIPQHPLILEGTVRRNLDPFGLHDDDTLCGVLERVGLTNTSAEEDAAGDAVDGEGGDGEGGEGGEGGRRGRKGPSLSATARGTAALLEEQLGTGSSLSSGECQLVSLARTLLENPPAGLRVVVMDEPTANTDAVTDKRIQKIVREAFVGCTVITIAHRLATIIDSDRILVLDAGKLTEYGAPTQLLGDAGGDLSSMVDSLGPDMAEELRRRADEAFRKSTFPSVDVQYGARAGRETRKGGGGGGSGGGAAPLA